MNKAFFFSFPLLIMVSICCFNYKTVEQDYKSMYTKKTSPESISKRKVNKWIKGKGWSNGISQVPHASVDKEMFYKQYHANKAIWDKAFRFMKDNDLGQLKPGKYPIDGDHVYASVTESPNKEFEATKWESHRKYVDLQYIISGKEKMGVADASKAKVIKEYTPDVMNYETEGMFYTGEPGEFFLFFPNDAHRPNIKVDGVESVKKLVIKIEMK